MAGPAENFQHLVSTEWLAAHLDDRELRVFDCTMQLIPDPELVYRVENLRGHWAKGHIPGSGYIDLVADLSDRNTKLRFMFPPVAQAVESLERLGVDDGSRVVLYSSNPDMQWATRVWWMLRCLGFDNAAVLDGGLRKWAAEGRPLSVEPAAYPRGRLTAQPRLHLMCDRNDVLASIEDRSRLVVNALSREQHAGTGGVSFGRPGRITGSVNVPSRELIDPATCALLPLEQLRQRFDEVGATRGREVVAYCGGGIAATVTMFVLTLLGHDKLRLYDASMQEWAVDDSLPMERG